jgi:hypothetical protein
MPWLSLIYEFTDHHNLYTNTKIATIKEKCKPYLRLIEKQSEDRNREGKRKKRRT